jgi:hypothetical protein
MHADVETVAVAFEGLGQATELTVALDDEDTLALTRERCRRGQSADSRIAYLTLPDRQRC